MREVDDTWSTAALIEVAFVEQQRDDDTLCPATVALQQRGSREVLEAALTLCRSLDSQWRSLGACLLGQLGHPDPTYPEECCDALVGLLRRDASTDVLIAAIYGLGHLGDHRCDADLLAYGNHPEPAIRKGIAFALVGTTFPAAVPVLLTLMNDPYVQARDWATTALGAATCFDGPEVREALLQRAERDDDDITRGEALHGLARRGDRRARPLIAAELTGASGSLWAFEAAARTCLGLDEAEPVKEEDLIAALRADRH